MFCLTGLTSDSLPLRVLRATLVLLLVAYLFSDFEFLRYLELHFLVSLSTIYFTLSSAWQFIWTSLNSGLRLTTSFSSGAAIPKRLGHKAQIRLPNALPTHNRTAACLKSRHPPPDLSRRNQILRTITPMTASYSCLQASLYDSLPVIILMRLTWAHCYFRDLPPL
jgi:hypothetical protein